MSTVEGRTVTLEEVERVKILIEKCILKYMKMKEAIDVLYQQHNIEPCFTKIIWKNLEEQNKDFFRNYRLRLALIHQITRFNNLIDKQASLMKNQLNRNELVTCPPIAVQPVPSDLPSSGFNNYSVYPFDTLLAQNPNIEMIEQRMNENNHGIPMNSECASVPSSSNYSVYPFDTLLAQDLNIEMMEQRVDNNKNGIPMNNESASVSSSSNMDSYPHPLERTFTDDLNAYMSQLLGYSPFDSNGITLENQGENNGITNISSDFNFHNSGYIEMPQRSNIVWMQLRE